MRHGDRRDDNREIGVYVVMCVYIVRVEISRLCNSKISFPILSSTKKITFRILFGFNSIEITLITIINNNAQLYIIVSHTCNHMFHCF